MTDGVVCTTPHQIGGMDMVLHGTERAVNNRIALGLATVVNQRADLSETWLGDLRAGASELRRPAVDVSNELTELGRRGVAPTPRRFGASVEEGTLRWTAR